MVGYLQRIDVSWSLQSHRRTAWSVAMGGWVGGWVGALDDVATDAPEVLAARVGGVKIRLDRHTDCVNTRTKTWCE